MPFTAEHWRGLLDALDYGVALLDAEARLLYANRSIVQLFALETAPEPGVAMRDAFPAFSEELDWAHAARTVVERGRALRLARHAVRPGVQADAALSQVRLGPEATPYALLTAVDVSEAVHFEERLLRQARTQAIANLGDSVAHEIRNPLNSIHMNVQLLRERLKSEGVQDPQLDRMAETIQREIRRLDRVVRDFVQYSRPPALHPVPGSVNRVVRAALDLLDAQIREKSIHVEDDLQSARPVAIDPDRLQRAFYNLLLNAVQVLPEGGHIACRSRDEERHCLVEISDDGPGLDLQQSAHIFDLFHTTKPGGTGLGLPLANRIVEEHGGHVAVASEPGHGATFAIFLPYEGPPAPGPAGPTAVPVHPEGGAR